MNDSLALIVSCNFLTMKTAIFITEYITNVGQILKASNVRLH